MLGTDGDEAAAGKHEVSKRDAWVDRCGRLVW